MANSSEDDVRNFGEERSSWRSLGHAKSKGVDLTFSYPRAWRAMEGERPHVVQKFVGPFQNGGLDQAMIMVKPMPSPLNKELSSEETDQFLSGESAASLVPDNGTLTSYKRTKVDGKECALIEYEFPVERVAIIGEGLGIAVYFEEEGNFVMVGLASLAATTEQLKRGAASARYLKAKPLFTAMLSRLVITGKWLGGREVGRSEFTTPANAPSFEEYTASSGAIALAKSASSKGLTGISVNNESRIRSMLEEFGEAFSDYAWRAQPIDQQTYLVVCNISLDGQPYDFRFRVNLEARTCVYEGGTALLKLSPEKAARRIDPSEVWGENDPVVEGEDGEMASAVAKVGPSAIAASGGGSSKEQDGLGDEAESEGMAKVNVGGLTILLPTELTNFTKENLSDPAIGSLDKFTAISGTRSVLVKHFSFEPSRYISPEKAASMSDEELKTYPSYSSTRLSTNVAGKPAIRLNTKWKLGNTSTEQDIVFFGEGRSVWEVHIFGIDDPDKDSLQQMKAAAFESITIQ